jgi:hypothetical protein
VRTGPGREDAAIAALLTEPTLEAAAARAGVAKKTLCRWLAESSFKARYREARRQVVEGAIGRLQAAATLAVDALERNLTCGIPAVEVGAARSVLDHAIKAVETGDVLERLEALEAALEQGGRPTSRLAS